MKRRRGFTLSEMLVTLTTGSSLMLLAIGLVHQSFSLSKLAKTRSEHERSIARMALQFRSDAHSAVELTAVSADSVVLKMPDHSAVSYRCDAANVTRQHDGKDVEVARDVFPLDENCSVTFASQAAPSRALLQIERRLKNSEIASKVDLRVVAVIGRWQELEQSPEPSTVGAPLRAAEVQP
jgi:prepilin-type N-terminal cleavage/methylation domain-containing protein